MAALSTSVPRILVARRMAAALSIIGAGFALSGCVPTVAGTPSATEATHDVFAISVGDCLNDSTASGKVATVPKVDCASQHDSEAYFSGTLPDGAFPGDTAVASGAEEICGPAFKSFIGKAVADSAYNYSYYVPTTDSWASGDREVVCVAFARSGAQVTGTLKGINS